MKEWLLIIGLISSHAYSITGFGGDVNHGKCLRLLNPWGHYEYTGSESHVLNDVDDGEFVIKWTEFCKYFPYNILYAEKYCSS